MASSSFSCSLRTISLISRLRNSSRSLRKAVYERTSTIENLALVQLKEVTHRAIILFFCAKCRSGLGLISGDGRNLGPCRSNRSGNVNTFGPKKSHSVGMFSSCQMRLLLYSGLARRLMLARKRDGPADDAAASGAFLSTLRMSSSRRVRLGSAVERRCSGPRFMVCVWVCEFKLTRFVLKIMYS